MRNHFCQFTTVRSTKNSRDALHLCEPNKCAKFFSYRGLNKNIDGVACFFSLLFNLLTQWFFKIKQINLLHMIEIG